MISSTMSQYSVALYLIILLMFPTTTKDYRQLLLQPSPKNSRDPNRSTYLPYFRRFPNQKFHSQQKKRHEEVNLAPRRFFTEEKEQQGSNELLPTNKVFSNVTIKQHSPNKLRPRLFRQLYERESNKIKRASEHSIGDRNRLAINSSFNVHSTNYLTPAQVVRIQNNLTELELSEIEEYEEVYYYGQNCIKKVYDDSKVQKEGDEGYPWAKGDHIAYRYELIELLGEGSFGQVFKCLDHKSNRAPMALKIVKHNEKYLTQAKIQIKILNIIKNKDKHSSKNCIEMKDYFPFRNRICMTFGLMSMNLYELIKSNGYYGLPLDLIRRFVLQILNGIHFLHRNRVIHADLKPENILLKQMNKSGVKIIDFGSSCLENETIYTYIQSRYYRAPEVILGLPYDRKIDIWSFGCIIAELHLGYPLFGGEDEHQQMCLIVQVLGMPPKTMIPNSKRWHVFFDNNNVLKPHEKRAAPASKSLLTALENVEEQFVEFIRLCLQWNPDRRIQALELMKHNWVLKELPNDFREQHLKFINQQETQMIQDETQMLRKSRKHTFAIRDKHRLIK